MNHYQTTMNYFTANDLRSSLDELETSMVVVFLPNLPDWLYMNVTILDQHRRLVLTFLQRTFPNLCWPQV